MALGADNVDAVRASAAARVAVALAVTATLIGVVGSDATPVGAHEFSGTVVDDETGQPVESICVYYTAFYGEWGQRVVWTDAQGQFSITNNDVPVTFATVSECASAPPTREGYLDGTFHGLVPSGNLLPVTRGGTITGVAVDEATGDPIPDLCVSARGEGLRGTTNTQGEFRVRGLERPNTTLTFDECAWRDPGRDMYFRRDVAASGVVIRQITDVGVTEVTRGGAVAGVVRDAATGAPIQGICVRPWRTGGATLPPESSLVDEASRQTNAAGEFRVSRLWESDYRFEFRDCGAGLPLLFRTDAYATRYNGGSYTSAGAPSVPISLASLTPLDADLEWAPIITGTTSIGGEPRSVRMELHPVVNGSHLSLAGQAERGFYRKSVQPGTYKLEFDAAERGLAEWYDDAPTEEAAQAIVLEPGDVFTADVDLFPGATVSGVVVDEASGAPIEGICVDRSQGGGRVRTAADGSFTMHGFTGPQTLRFWPCFGTPAYEQEWFDNARSEDEAQEFDLDYGETLDVGTIELTPTPQAQSPARVGYWMLDGRGAVYAFGDAQHLGAPSADAVDLEPTPSGAGYWIVSAQGNVYAYNAPHLGGVPGGSLLAGELVTSMSRTPSGNGYWLFTTRGRVFAFGDAPFLGDMRNTVLNGPVLDSIATPSGAGYYMVASDGGVFAFGDAQFYGSMGGRALNAPVMSLVPDADGVGYWLVASDGGIFAFQSEFFGSMGGRPLNAPVTGMIRFGVGYLMVATDGGIFNFSNRPFLGSLGAAPPAVPVVSVASMN